MKLFKTKVATRNAIYKLVSPLTRGFFSDNSWENVNKIWKALEAEGIKLNVFSAEYDKNACPPTFKRWMFTADVNGFYFNGTLVACFCGTVEDPTNRYDLCFII